MNTAIEGAKTPAEIMARASAAKLATQQAETEKWKPGLLHQQAGAAASSAVLSDAQAAKSNIEAENAAYGKQVEQFRRLADRGDITSVMEMFWSCFAAYSEIFSAGPALESTLARCRVIT